MTTRSTVGRPHVARALAAVFTLFGATLLGIQMPVAANAAGTASISGKVILESGVPAEWMQAVSVMVSSVSDSSYGYANLESDGTYSVTGLDAGSYRVRYSVGSYWDPQTQTSVQPNLVSEYYGDTTDYSAAKLVSVTAGGTASQTDVTLGRGGILAGKVTLPSDAPASWYQGVTVSASGKSYGYGTLKKNGSYEIVGLEPGDYRVQFATTTYWTESNPNVRPNLITEYYDNAETYDAAKVVTLTKGKTTSGINATLEKGATITGKVSLPAGVPAGWMSSISIGASLMTGNGSSAHGDIADDGTYTITGVRPGEYRVSFAAFSTWWNPATQQSEPVNLISEYYNDAKSYSSAQPVTVTAGATISKIDATLAKGAAISGKITLPPSAPAEWLRGLYVSASNDEGSSQGGPVGADGSYTLTGLSGGNYRVYVSVGTYDGPDGKRIAPNLLSEYYDGTRDWNTAKKVTVAEGAAATKIDIALDAGASIAGKISLPAGVPSEWMQGVYVNASAVSGEYVPSQTVKSDDGTYTVSGLPAGDYKLMFSVYSYFTPSGSVQPNLVPEYYDDAADLASARTLSLASGQVRGNTNVTLAKGAEFRGAVSGLAPGTSTYIELINTATPEGLGGAGAAIAADGSFTVSGLRAGSYWVRVNTFTPGGISQWQFVKNPAGGYAFALSGSGLSNQKLTALPATASIAGSLTSSGFTAQPLDPEQKHYLADTRVYQKLDSSWVPLDIRGSYVSGAVSAETNGTVSYTVPGLTAGTYTVGFEKSQTPYSTNPAVTEQWWQKKTSLASADALTLSAGQKRTGIHGTVTGPVPPATGFIDIAGSAFTKEITWMYDQGISTGYEVPAGREYRPFGKVTRDAMAAFLYRAAGSPSFDLPSTSPFTDVPTNHPFYKEIAWMDREKISTGWTVGSGKEYRPTLNITRDAMAAFLYRYAKATDPAPASSPFVDVPIDSSFLKEIAWMSKKGLSTGYDVGNGTRAFKPFDDITRDAMAAFLYRYKNQ